MANVEYSKNKKVYATFDGDNFSEAGLAAFAKLLAGNGAPVASITASNRLIAKDDTKFKKADFYFENGQRITIRIRETGDLVAVAVNGKALPIKNADSLQSIAKELADYLKKGQAEFDKSLARKLKAIKVDSAVKPAGKTNQQRIDELKTAVAEAETQQATARAELTSRNELYQQLTSEEAQLQEQLRASIDRSKELKSQLKGAAA